MSRGYKTGAWLILGVVAVAVLVFAVSTAIVDHHKKNANAPACSTAAQPCLELLDTSGQPTGIKFNDYELGSRGCVYYRLTMQDSFKEYCGGYTMLWIGPVPETPGTPGAPAGSN